MILQIQKNLDSDRSEDGSQLEITAQDRAESKRLWKAREKRVQHVIINVALQQKVIKYTINVFLVLSLFIS